jgi:glucokinase
MTSSQPGRDLSVGLDLGGTKCLGVAVCDDDVVAEVRRPTPEGAGAVLATLVDLVARLRAECGPGATVGSVGVGVPGLVDRAGVLQVAPHLAGVTGLQVKKELERVFLVDVTVDNDATCAAWGEHRRGAARGLSDVVMVTLGTGIGGGIVAGGRVCRGAHGFAGELGHMVVDPDGPTCPCGQKGCWERYASGTALGELARQGCDTDAFGLVRDLAGGVAEDVRGEHVTGAAAEGDPFALKTMAAFAWWVALGLVNLANVLDPEAFVLGGGLIVAGDALLGPTRVAFAQLLQGSDRRPPVPILGAALGARAGALGAAFLACDSEQHR